MTNDKMRHNDVRKIIVVGLDGATWKLLDPLMEEGIMPNLKKIVQKGTSGILLSTIPPYTAPAWVSCTTGVNPGKHGIFGFTSKKNDLMSGDFLDSTDVQVPKIWNYINHTNRTVGLINVPITYPTEPVNGFMVPCFFTPLGKIDYTYPKSIYKEILKPLNYVINTRSFNTKNPSEGQISENIRNIKFMTKIRYKVMEKLSERYNPDFLMTVFTSPDKVQHKFWKYIDSNDPLSKTTFALKIKPLLLSVYEQVDTILGKILKKLDSKTTLYIVSDHGFGPQKNFLFINKWLSENEFLSIKKIRLLLYKLNSKIGNKRLFFKRNVDIVKHPIYRFINYKKSSFISGDQYEHGIYRIHDAESHESLKIINLLIEKLNRLRNNETEMPVFERIYKKNEIYSGEYVKNAPDIILKLNDYSTNILRDYPFRKNILLKSISPTDTVILKEL